MSDTVYISTYGVLDDFVSDHYTVYAIRKKQKEHNVFTRRTVRD